MTEVRSDAEIHRAGHACAWLLRCGGAVVGLVILTGCGRAGCDDRLTSQPVTETTLTSADPPLPGLGTGDAELIRRLERALASKGADYRPRSHHLHEGGSPHYTNRLILETSPYLLQHAHNPVNWYPWGDEAFERARREGKPVLLSVGYSTCHWCHVMERESFEDEEIARYLNEHFVAIKVDREERPDVDDVYMQVVQMITGRGGWPMTVALTPDRQAFFGGTYFPARDGDRGSSRGFLTILRDVSREFEANRGQLVARAHQITARLTEAASNSTGLSEVPPLALIDRTVGSLATSFDRTWGGFGRAPKFPRPAALELLLRQHARTGGEDALQMAVLTLDRMAAGGVYDQVGGGFHRYSTDARWLVPHFEKMLYDNAQLVPLYLAAAQLTGRGDLTAVARDTLDYVAREMTASGGAFFSATDADSATPDGEEEEGYFFTWTPRDVEEAAGAKGVTLARAFYGLSDRGHLERRSILHRSRSRTEVGADLGLAPDILDRDIDRLRSQLREHRNRRPPPHLDDKIITSWNGLMISALAQAGLLLGEANYVERAVRAADFILRELRQENGRLRRSYREGRAKHEGYLDDYAFLIQGLLDLYEATSTWRWFEAAVALQQVLDRRFWDTSSGGYFLTSDDHESLLTRAKPSYDGAEPSGNSVAVSNLLRLSAFTGKDDYRERASRTLAAFARSLARSPVGSPKLLSALDFHHDSPLEVALVVPAGEDAEALLRVFRNTYVRSRVFTLQTDGPELERQSATISFLSEKRALDGRATAYVCERGRCELPTTSPDVFRRQLERRGAYSSPR